jgi:hypothetical protein
METGTPGAEQLVTQLKKEKNEGEREKMLKQYNDGELYKTLQARYFPAHRMACCTGIYYNNVNDGTTLVLNGIIDELTGNPAPDYAALLKELEPYKDDPRAMNLWGVIEYRRHHRHAAEKAFAKAAEMGDEQAMVNLMIVENEKSK